MSFNESKKKGFTLVELLIVIAIIGVLSTLAINGYTQYRRSTLLDLAADNLVAQVYEFRDRAIHGNFGSERAKKIEEYLQGESEELETPLEEGESLCYGLYFEKNSESGVFDVYSFDQNFKGNKVWKGEIKGWRYEGCGDVEGVERDPLILEDVTIQKIVLLDEENNETDVNQSFIMRFFPPYGDLEIRWDQNPFIEDFSDPAAKKKAKIIIKYGVSEENLYKRAVVFDFLSSNASVTNVE